MIICVWYPVWLYSHVLHCVFPCCLFLRNAVREYTYIDLVPGETYTLYVDAYFDGQPVPVALAVTTSESMLQKVYFAV